MKVSENTTVVSRHDRKLEGGKPPSSDFRQALLWKQTITKELHIL